MNKLSLFVVALVAAAAVLLLPAANARADPTGVVTNVTDATMDENSAAVASDPGAIAFWQDGTATFGVTLDGSVSLVQYMINGPGYPNGDPEDPNDPYWKTMSGNTFSVTTSPTVQGFYEVDFQTDGPGGPTIFDENGPWYFGLDYGAPTISYKTYSQAVATKLDDGKWHNLRQDLTKPAKGSITFHAEDWGSGLHDLTLLSGSSLMKEWQYNCQISADVTIDITQVGCAVLKWTLDATDEYGYLKYGHFGYKHVTMKIDTVAPKFTKPKSMKVKRGRRFTIPVRVIDPPGVNDVCSRLHLVRATLTGPSFKHQLCLVQFHGEGEQEYDHGVTGNLMRVGTYTVDYFARDMAGNVTTASFPLHVTR